MDIYLPNNPFFTTHDVSVAFDFHDITFVKQMLLFVDFEDDASESDMGWCFYTEPDYDGDEAIGHIFINLANHHDDADEILRTLVHEVTHISQYYYGDLTDNGVGWKWYGVEWDPETDRDTHPWELEAERLEDVMLDRVLYYRSRRARR